MPATFELLFPEAQAETLQYFVGELPAKNAAWKITPGIIKLSIL